LAGAADRACQGDHIGVEEHVEDPCTRLVCYTWWWLAVYANFT
jgi:hypothetical protein